MRLAAFRGARPLALLFVFVTLMLGPLAMSQSVPGHKQDAGNNNMSPPGAILDLSGTPIPGGARSVYQQYSVNFTATLASTVITFGFRDDPSFISFSNASVIDLTSNSANLLVNGNFSAGIFTTNGNADAPTGWVYSNQFGATFGGKVDGDCGVGAGGDYGVGATMPCHKRSQPPRGTSIRSPSGQRNQAPARRMSVRSFPATFPR